MESDGEALEEKSGMEGGEDGEGEVMRRGVGEDEGRTRVDDWRVSSDGLLMRTGSPCINMNKGPCGELEPRLPDYV